MQAIQPRAAGPLAKRAEDVAAQIEAHIVELGWPAGRVLGSEKELLERYRVSRASLREAVRLLEYHRVARMRPGPRGGLVVMEPDPEAVARSMALFLSHARVNGRQLLEMRGIVEGHAAALAATTATAAQLRELMAMLDRPQEKSQPCQALEFHIRVAQLSRNPVMELFVRCLTALTSQQAAESPARVRREAVLRANEVHRYIASAIVARDPELARRRMTRHIQAIDPLPAEVPAAAGKAA